MELKPITKKVVIKKEVLENVVLTLSVQEAGKLMTLLRRVRGWDGRGGVKDLVTNVDMALAELGIEEYSNPNLTIKCEINPPESTTNKSSE